RAPASLSASSPRNAGGSTAASGKFSSMTCGLRSMLTSAVIPGTCSLLPVMAAYASASARSLCQGEVQAVSVMTIAVAASNGSFVDMGSRGVGHLRCAAAAVAHVRHLLVNFDMGHCTRIQLQISRDIPAGCQPPG